MLVTNLATFGLLRIYRVPPEAVAVYWDGTVGRREYWRCLTAAFSHYDAWHLSMNVLSLWNLGAYIASVRLLVQADLRLMRTRCRLEDVYGSAHFALLSIAAGAAADFVAFVAEFAIKRLRFAQISRAMQNVGRVSTASCSYAGSQGRRVIVHNRWAFRA